MFAGVNIGLMELSGPAKRGYHHGDLRNALVAAAAELAAKGGPEAVTVRAAAREVGVTPTAAYRHFARHEELLIAAKQIALNELTEAMNREIARRPVIHDPVRRALARLGALGRGYLAFARTQPGLFRTIFSSASPDFPHAIDRTDTSPYQLLLRALDELVEVGYVRPEQRPMAEFAAWSAVHGLATLLDGPINDMPPSMQDEAIVRTMLILGHGLSGSGLSPEQEASLEAELSRGD